MLPLKYEYEVCVFSVYVLRLEVGGCTDLTLSEAAWCVCPQKAAVGIKQACNNSTSVILLSKEAMTSVIRHLSHSGPFISV